MRWYLFLLIFLSSLCRAQTLHKHPHSLAERLAHFDVYELGTGVNGGMRADEQGKRNIENTMGLKVLDTIYDIPDGFSTEHQQERFAAMVVQDTNKQPPQTFIVFRGTDDQEDVVQYVQKGLRGKVEVGQQQFEKHREQLKQWARLYPDAVVTGHSLGGALAQRYVAEFPQNCKELVTFQAPGTEEEVAKRLDTFRGKNTLYVSLGDKVTNLGARHGGSPDVVVVEIEGVDAKEAHKNLLIQEKGATSPYPSKSTGQKLVYNPKGQVRSRKRVLAEEFQRQRGLVWDGLKDLKDQGTVVVVKVQLQGGPPYPSESPQVSVEGVRVSAPQNEARVRVPSYIRPGEIIRVHASAQGYAKKVLTFTVLEQTNPIFVSLSLEKAAPAVLRATVRDQETLEALALARLEAEDGTFVLTGQDGTASLDLPKPQEGDQALVRVSRNGYKPRRGSVRIKEGVARAAVSLEPVLKVRLGGPTRSATAVNCTYQVSVEGGKSPYRYTWFLDGTRQQASSEQVSMVWTKPGDHVLAVEVVEGGGNSRSKRLPVTVEAGKLELEMSGPTRVTVSDQSEYQVEIVGGKPPYRMQWFLNGERANVQEDRISVVMTWAKVNPGAYQLRAVVTDAVGVVAQAEKSIQLEGFTVSASGPRQAVVGQQSQYRVSASGGKPPYSYQWFLNGSQQNADGEAISVTWKNPGRCPLRIVVADATGARAEVADTIEVSPPTPEQPSTPPSEGAYNPVVGTYSGQIEKRMPDKSLRPYPGLSLTYDGKNVGGVMRCGRDQGMLLDMRWKGTWKNLRIQGVSQRKLSGEIQGTVNGVHPVQGGFLVSEVQAQSWRGSWYVNFQNGEKWSGRFQVSR